MLFHILHIDSNETCRERIAPFLRRHNCVLHHAASTVEATDILFGEPIDLVLCEDHLTTLSGLAFLRLIRVTGNFSRAALPFIFLHGGMSETRKSKARQFGADDFIEKNAPLAMLHFALEQSLPNHFRQIKTRVH